MTNKVKRWEDYDKVRCLDGQIIDMNKLLDDQERAKAALAHIEPFFQSMIGKLRFVYTFRVKTQATDGYNIFVNPQFTYNLTLEQKVFVLAHEIMHCVLDHMRRGQQAGHPNHKSNVAADYEVNATLVDLDITNVGTINAVKALYDKKYTGWGYEKIYDSNPPDPTQGKQSQPKQGQSGQNGQKGQGQGQPGSGQGGQGQGQSAGSGSGDRSDNQKHSADWKAGWKKAIEDIAAGKIKP